MSDSDDFYGEDRRDEKRTRKQNTKKKKNNDKVWTMIIKYLSRVMK